MVRALGLILVLACLLAPPAFAADKKDLARQVEAAWPMARQVDKMIDGMAEGLPQDKQASFKSYMRNELNYKAIEKISTDAMAETFTKEELEAMLEFYSKPEARSVSDKMKDYQQKVMPEITRMIDKVMMKARTGGN